MDNEEDIDRRIAERDDETRRDNLIFHGLDRKTSGTAMTTVTNFLTNKLDFSVNPNELKSADHIGGKTTIVGFQDYSKKKAVMTAMKELSSHVAVKSDYSPRSRRARGQLFPLFLELKNKHKADARLVRDRVAVGDTEYLLHERRNCVEKRVRGQKSEFLPLPTRQLERPEPRAVPASETAQPNDEPMNTDDSNPGSGFATPPEHIRDYYCGGCYGVCGHGGATTGLGRSAEIIRKMKNSE